MDITINKQLLRERLEIIEEIHEHIKAVESAMRFKPGVDCGGLLQSLLNSELEEWRKLFMWAITLDAKSLTRIKAAAYARFLSKEKSPIHWLDSGVSPSSWLKVEDDEFKRMVKELFIEGENYVDIKQLLKDIKEDLEIRGEMDGEGSEDGVIVNLSDGIYNRLCEAVKD
jgi:hypothetical protein